jgi:hypothetical protein
LLITSPSGRPFGGLINDIKRKKPFYWSDFKDSFALQCVASMIFIYFACLTSFITFGGLLGDATENRQTKKILPIWEQGCQLVFFDARFTKIISELKIALIHVCT